MSNEKKVKMIRKTDLRLGRKPAPDPGQDGDRKKARIHEMFPAEPDGLDEILFDLSDEPIPPSGNMKILEVHPPTEPPDSKD